MHLLDWTGRDPIQRPGQPTICLEATLKLKAVVPLLAVRHVARPDQSVSLPASRICCEPPAVHCARNNNHAPPPNPILAVLTAQQLSLLPAVLCSPSYPSEQVWR